MKLPSTIQEIQKNNLRCFRIENAHATAEIYAHGAHLAHYQPRVHKPVLWMSERSDFATGEPIRGGVPLCFPWFGAKKDDANAPAHGLARLSDWRLKSASEDEAATELIFVPSPEILVQNDWPKCDVLLRVSIGEQLNIRFQAHNNSASTCSYEIALHSYFAVSDVRQISIAGLENARYWDKVAQSEFAAENAPLRFNGETDRVYDSASTCTVRDEAWQREIVVEKGHSQNTVVWNPWLEKAALMGDFGDDEWPHMACIETANVGENCVVLAPNEGHSTSATISVRDLR